MAYVSFQPIPGAPVAEWREAAYLHAGGPLVAATGVGLVDAADRPGPAGTEDVAFAGLL
ncbi:hypothetical protein Airi02_039330 [Actinoallomurus iriomotensis]|uniref:Uncharacterized protein n=1 Tax=Actinoallomurus iriomotensis TaxID=478107 RepID=A0A9W6W050_9ACTN|nr:hypothetical protein Airi02_039330 [Actinoallomurus iriomotensis]